MEQSVATRRAEESVVVKTDISRQLKLDFKILCIKQKTTMSLSIEQLLRKWLSSNEPVCQQDSFYSQERLEVVGMYIPESLKVRLKILCMEQNISMKMVLSQLIEEWVLANLSTLLIQY